MILGFDPEVPAGFQDADIEMAEMAADADAHSDDCGVWDYDVQVCTCNA